MVIIKTLMIKVLSYLLFFGVALAIGCKKGSSTGQDNQMSQDTLAPSIMITSPADGDTFGYILVQIVAKATDNVGIAKMRLECSDKEEEKNIGSPQLSDSIYMIHHFDRGANLIRATVWDAANNKGSDSITVYGDY